MAAFQIDFSDNVATALEEIAPGRAELRGDAGEPWVEALEKFPKATRMPSGISQRGKTSSSTACASGGQ